MTSLNDYDWIGFDLDHTLIQYKLDYLYPFIYKIFTEALVKDKGYDSSLLQDNFEDLKDFCLRGLILDTQKGNILKIDKDGFILRATHGTKQMTREEITDTYGEKSIWPEINSLKENPSQQSSMFRVFENYFDLPVMVICARLIDIIDKKNGRLEKYNFWPDVIYMLRHVFNPLNFSDQNGYFFPVITKNTSKFIKPCSKKIIDWIKSLRDGKQKVFLLTNSYIDYTNLLMNFAVGEHWPEMFDVVVCMAGKPGFFKYEEQLTQFYEIDGEREGDPVKQLQQNRIYSRGNHRDFTAFLQKQTNKENLKVLYFGDSMRSDLFPSVVHGGWDVVTILEEMESEGLVIEHLLTHEDEKESLEDGPSPKKPAKYLHDHIEIERHKEEVLLSNQWGSFFTDAGTAQEGPSKDYDPCFNNVLDGFFVCNKAKERREMNTFWGDVIQKYSTITIPRIDFITELPLDHEFQLFSASAGGFYPGSPKSLHL
ncbi:5'-nucleotidase domain-containing protein 1-like [Porites lutea]|uniref:5'-nucleotidase domain-containing protein 1-like n=1 Tax=Porites lutea TaxID=51062 RepID=UPI003CC6D43F